MSPKEPSVSTEPKPDAEVPIPLELLYALLSLLLEIVPCLTEGYQE